MSLRLKEKLSIKSPVPTDGVASFIRKTYELLEERSHADIVSWSDCGNFIVIRDTQEFSQKILPVYFKHSNMNSFIRQLNMYNFHKKRTMTTDHVYYHDLFKKGKTELLRHIKRKHAEHQGLYPSSYEALQSLSIDTAEISQENLMLKKLNQRAFSKISSLEAKVADLKNENEKLMLKISDKQKKEEILGSAFSDFFQPKDSLQLSTSQEKKPTSHYYPDKETELLYTSKDVENYSSQNKSSLLNNMTPDTSLSDENDSNVDSFLNLDATEPMSSDFTNPNTSSYDKNTQYVNLTYTEDSSVLNKRKYIEFESDIYLSVEGQEPTKIPCLSNYEEEQKHGFNEIDFQIIFDNPIQERC
jgi:heat shock transcription factor